MTEHKIRVGFDWDDVIEPWYAPAHEACKRAGITNGVEPKTWSCYEEYGITSAAWKETLTAASHRGEVYGVGPTEEALWAMRDLYWNLGDKVEIVIATARAHFPIREPAWLEQTVRDAIDEYAVPCDELAFVVDKRDAMCDWFIDDSVKQFAALHNEGAKVYLRNQPWNVLAPIQEIYRVNSVTEYVNIVKEALGA